MDTQKNVERLASLETELKGIKELMFKMDGKLDAWNQNYVPRQELNEMFRARDLELERLRVDTTNIASGIRIDLDKFREQQKQDARSNKALLPSWVAIAVSSAALLHALLK